MVIKENCHGLLNRRVILHRNMSCYTVSLTQTLVKNMKWVILNYSPYSLGHLPLVKRWFGRKAFRYRRIEERCDSIFPESEGWVPSVWLSEKSVYLFGLFGVGTVYLAALHLAFWVSTHSSILLAIWLFGCLNCLSVCLEIVPKCQHCLPGCLNRLNANIIVSMCVHGLPGCLNHLSVNTVSNFDCRYLYIPYTGQCRSRYPNLHSKKKVLLFLHN